MSGDGVGGEQLESVADSYPNVFAGVRYRAVVFDKPLREAASVWRHALGFGLGEGDCEFAGQQTGRESLESRTGFAALLVVRPMGRLAWTESLSSCA